jgi:hypothetical protein
MKLTTKILALACAGLLALAGTASAHHGNARATVYVAKLMAPGAAATTPAPQSTMKAAQAPTTPMVSGRALLVDGSQNNILVVHVRGLTPNTAYTFDIAGSADFPATAATTNDRGKLNGFLKNTTFNAVAGTTYTVEVKDAAGTVVASGDLQPLRKHGRHHGRHHGKRHGFASRFGHHGKHGNRQGDRQGKQD